MRLHRSISLLLISALLLFSVTLFSGCATAARPEELALALPAAPEPEKAAPAPEPAAAEPVDTEPSAAEASVIAPAELLRWSINLSGKNELLLESSQLIGSDNLPAHRTSITVEVKGENRTYTGIPLYMVLAMVDGSEENHPYIFDYDAWEAGYEVTATAADGYSAAFFSADYAYDSTIIAYEQDGSPISPMLIGTELTKDLWVKDVAAIELSMETAAAVIPTLTLTSSDVDITFTTAELKETPYYIEETGGYTTSAGTYYESLYGGVKLYALLNSFGDVGDDGSITAVASDGYEMSYAIADLKDTSEGTWIAAFEENGAPMAFDPGYIRIVKVGSPIPNIDGHSSAKMVKEIKFSAAPLRSFELTVSGKMEVLVDRASMQSGISCTAHKTDVEYLNKKSSEVEYYTGMPLFALLAIADDPDYAPHKQTDHDIKAYDAEAARKGYKVKISAADGYSITLDSRELDGNQDVIVAMYQDGEELGNDDWPLKLVWDQNAARIPEGIKAVRQLTRIDLIFE
jgi:hypothetical protein